MEELVKFIQSNPDSRELKRALGVQMVLKGYLYRQIAEILSVSDSFIAQMVVSVRGRRGDWVAIELPREQGLFECRATASGNQLVAAEELLESDTITTAYSRQIQHQVQIPTELLRVICCCGYQLEENAKIKPKKSSAPGQKKLEILVQLKQWLPEIAAGRMSVFFLDECHLLWGDVCGYIWGKSNRRIEVPIVNERQKQTYYGALDYFNHEFLVQAYPRANSEHTISFLDYKQEQRPHQRIAIIWDGASYHRSQELKTYLQSLNSGRLQPSWQLTCIRFAPNAPEQNPVEDVWLQAKRFLREFYHLCDSFSLVKLLFELVTHGRTFNFPKLFMYAVIPQLT